MNSSANFLIRKISNERLYFSRFIEQTIQCFIRWFQSFVKKKNKEKVKVVQFMNYTVDKNESINLKTQRKRRVKKKVKEKKKKNQSKTRISKNLWFW